MDAADGFGRAVSRQAGEPWRNKLLALPAFLGAGTPSPAELRDGFALMGFLLARHIYEPLPAARPPLHRGGGARRVRCIAAAPAGKEFSTHTPQVAPTQAMIESKEARSVNRGKQAVILGSLRIASMSATLFHCE